MTHASTYCNTSIQYNTTPRYTTPLYITTKVTGALHNSTASFLTSFMVQDESCSAGETSFSPKAAGCRCTSQRRRHCSTERPWIPPPSRPAPPPAPPRGSTTRLQEKPVWPGPPQQRPTASTSMRY